MANFTKEAIKNTFIRLLDSRPLNQITVKMIVEECGINRNSFYYHYEDLPSLIDEIVMEEADRIIAEYHSIDSIETALQAVLDFASRNRRAILHIYNSLNRDIFEQYLWKVCDYVISAYGESIVAESRISQEDLDMTKHFFRCASFGVVMEWLHNGMPADVQNHIDRFCALQQEILENILAKKSN